jgi:hypothetical protein
MPTDEHNDSVELGEDEEGEAAGQQLLRPSSTSPASSAGEELGGDAGEAVEPGSIHHAATVYLLADHCPAWQKCMWLACSYGLAFLQCFVMQGASNSLNPLHTDCTSAGNGACPDNTFCEKNDAGEGRCLFCGYMSIIQRAFGEYNSTLMDVTTVCFHDPDNPACAENRCVVHVQSFLQPHNLEWDPTTTQSRIDDNVQGMDTPAKAMLWLAGFLVAIEAAKDARDIRVSDLYARIYLRKRKHDHGFSLWLVTAAPLFALKIIRSFVMIPWAIALVPLLTIWQSASAIDIAMNALATVFSALPVALQYLMCLRCSLRCVLVWLSSACLPLFSGHRAAIV